MGIPIGSNFDLSTPLPLDQKIVRTNASDLAGIGNAYNGLETFLTSDNTKYRYQSNGWVKLYSPTYDDFTNHKHSTLHSPDGAKAVATASDDAFLTVSGKVRIGLKPSNNNLSLDVGGNIQFTPVIRPTNAEITGMVLANGGTGSIPAGTYYYAVAYYSLEGDTGSEDGYSFESSPKIVLATDSVVNISNIPISTDPRVIGRKIYRTQSGTEGDYFYMYLIATIENNTQTTYTDNSVRSTVANDWFFNKNNTTCGLMYNGSNLMCRSTSFVVSFGTGAFRSLTRGSRGAAFGVAALSSCTTGESNQSFGHYSGYNVTTGNNNNYFGFEAGLGNQTGGCNCGFGYKALRNNTTSSNWYNSGFGNQAGYTVSGNYNCFFGAYSGYSIGTGIGNTMVGYSSGYYSNGVNYNIFLGYNSGFYEMGSYKLFIDCMKRSNEATSRVSSIIYGEMSSTVSNQNLYVNANLYVRHALNVDTIYAMNQLLPISIFSSVNVSGDVNLTAGHYFKLNDAILNYSHVGAEAALGNPTVNGYVLSSTTAGVRSWISVSPSAHSHGAIRSDGSFLSGGSINFSSTGTVTANLLCDETTSGNVKTIGLGMGGLAGSNTNIIIGSNTDGAVTNTYVYGTTYHYARNAQPALSVTAYSGYAAILVQSGWIQTINSTTDSASLRIPHGTAPTTPVNGDMWTTTSGLYVRINGVTVGPLGTGGAGSIGGSGTANYMTKWANGTTLANSMIYDNGVVLGIGTTDVEAWQSSLRVIESAGSAIYMNHSGGSTGIISNGYYDSGGWKYKATGVASSYASVSGDHYFRVAASGTIDTTISWIMAMTVKNSGRVGIGSTDPETKLHVEDSNPSNVVLYATNPSSTGYGVCFRGGNSTNYMLELRDYSGSPKLRVLGNGNTAIGATDASGYMLYVNGNTNVAGMLMAQQITDSGFVRIINPSGGTYSYRNGTIMGAIKIKLPTAVNNSSTMFRMTVKIYTCITGKSYTFEIGGYNYYTGGWYNCFATCLTDSGENLDVRFGYDATGEAIWIGYEDMELDYPQINITEVLCGYYGCSASWTWGWSISFVTAFDTVETTITSARPWNNKNLTSTLTQNYIPLWGGTSLANSILRADSTTIANSGTFTSMVTGAAQFIGNCPTSAYWGIGSGSSGNALNIQGCDMYGTYNGSSINLFVTGTLSASQGIDANSYSGNGGYRSSGNYGGTGTASWHPTGIYSSGTNWLYGTCLFNGLLQDNAGSKWSISSTTGYATFTGYSTSWGVYGNGGVNVIQGTGGSATWLITGTSGGAFRGGIQLLDAGSYMRLYAGSAFLQISNTSIDSDLPFRHPFTNLTMQYDGSNYYVDWNTVTGTNKNLTVTSSITSMQIRLSNMYSGLHGDLRIVIQNTCTISMVCGGYSIRGNGSLSYLSAGVYHICWSTNGEDIDWNIAKYS